MCQYCEFQGSATNKEDRKRADFLDGSHEKFELFLHPTIDDESDYHFWIVDNSISDSIDSLAVKFCPMCGRDLTKPKKSMITLNTEKLLKTLESKMELLDYTKQFSKFPKDKEPLARSLMLLGLGKCCYNYLGGLMKPNFLRIFGNVYYCKTQSGFVNSAYDMLGDTSYSKGRVKKMLQGYPEKYPALVSFTDQTFEAGRILVEWLPFENLGI